MATEIVIASAARTPIGSFNGAFGSVPAHDLGKAAIKGALERAKVKPEEVDEVIMGQILSAGQGQNPARQAAVNSGIPVEKTALGINQLCGSGLRAVAFGWQAIRNGDASIMVVGGQESMSQAPHAGYMRDGTKMGEFKMIDTMLKDGLWDAFHGYHMGNTAENVAQKFQITRAEQDAFAASSQNKAEAAQKSGRFKDEIVPVTVKTRKGDVVVDSDEFPRHGTTVETLAKLRPAFTKEGGSVTAGNASGINDGAAALVVMSEAKAKELKLTPLAKIRSYASAGVDPSIMGMGPWPASEKALKKAGLRREEIDLWELNEAFAGQSLGVLRELHIPKNRVNVHGGAIALGHPIGASGARVLVTLLHAMQDRDARLGVASLCIGGGQGIAMVVERG